MKATKLVIGILLVAVLLISACSSQELSQEDEQELEQAMQNMTNEELTALVENETALAGKAIVLPESVSSRFSMKTISVFAARELRIRQRIAMLPSKVHVNTDPILQEGSDDKFEPLTS